MCRNASSDSGSRSRASSKTFFPAAQPRTMTGPSSVASFMVVPSRQQIGRGPRRFAAQLWRHVPAQIRQPVADDFDDQSYATLAMEGLRARQSPKHLLPSVELFLG